MRAIALICLLGLTSCNVQGRFSAHKIATTIIKGTDSTKTKLYSDDNKVTRLIGSYYNGKVITDILYRGYHPVSIQSTFVGKPYGHLFLFRPDESLKSYSYLIGKGNSASYRRSFEGKNQLEEGTPIVDHWNIEKDSLEILISSVFIEDAVLCWQIENDTTENAISLVSSQLEPMILEGYINTKGTQPVYLKLTCRDIYDNSRKVYRDTIFFAQQ